MSTLDEIGQEKQKIAERLARLDAERGRLAEALNELEVAERVLSRFGNAERPRRRPGRPPRATAAATPAPAPRRRGRRAAKAPSSQPSVSDAVLQVVRAHPGMNAAEVMQQLSSGFGLAVRPNHLGIALQRHRRARRLEQREERWFLPQEGAAA
jgi:hypothetical protein